MSTRFGTIKRVVAVLIAVVVVVAAAMVVGQAPEIFGADVDPEASIEFDDQTGNGTNVTIDAVSLSEGGFVVVTDGAGEQIAVSEYLGDGTHENVTVEANESADLRGRLTATVHRDTDDNESYDYAETDGEEDVPYLEDGFPVSDMATVTTTDGAEGAGNDSFLVESIEAPSTAGTNDTVEVTAEVRNPTDVETRQHVEFRLDGAVLERQMLDLDPDESREVNFEVDLDDTDPGNRTIGVYTADDGELADIYLEFEGEPALEVASATDSNVTVNATLPDDGFVSVADEDGEVVGTSEALSAGEHESVTVAFDRSVESDETLTASLSAGDPSDPENTTAVEADGEPVETTFTVDDVGDASGARADE